LNELPKYNYDDKSGEANPNNKPLLFQKTVKLNKYLEVQNLEIEKQKQLKKEKDETDALMLKSFSSMQNSFEVFKKIKTQKLIMVERKEQGKQMLEK
jgi:hypothetical protein